MLREAPSVYGSAWVAERELAIFSLRAAGTTELKDGRLRRAKGAELFEDAPKRPAKPPDVFSPRKPLIVAMVM
jgi:hypothetical protein